MATRKKKTTVPSMIGREVIVRSSQAGVFHGTLIAQSGADVTLANASKLWRWFVARMTGGQLATVAELAVHGIKRHDQARYSARVEAQQVLGACEVILVSKEASQTYRDVIG